MSLLGNVDISKMAKTGDCQTIIKYAKSIDHETFYLENYKFYG